MSLCSGKVVFHLLHKVLLLPRHLPSNRLEESLQGCHSQLAQLRRGGEGQGRGKEGKGGEGEGRGGEGQGRKGRGGGGEGRGGEGRGSV